MHPVIYKVFNANGAGDYSNGISPKVPVNEFTILPLLPLGHPDETLISSVLNGTYFKSGNQKISAEGVKILYQSDVPPIAVGKDL